MAASVGNKHVLKVEEVGDLVARGEFRAYLGAVKGLATMLPSGGPLEVLIALPNGDRERVDLAGFA